MERALRTAAMGMSAQQVKVDLIANNLANVNTTAFKRGRAEFQDLMYQTMKTPGSQYERNVEIPTEVQIGSGVKLVSTQKNFFQGELNPTGNNFDLAIQGDGFFQIKKPDGSISYTRDGSFKINRDGKMVSTDGYSLEPDITIPQDAVSVTVSTDGIVEVFMPNQVEAVNVGQIDIVKFINPAGLSSVGNNLYNQTSASGIPIPGTAGQFGFGEIKQGYLENSNVDIVEEMVNMISAQRGYEINSKTVTSADQMESTIINMAR
jgi:flagellar basal-body rod protein FlgG